MCCLRRFIKAKLTSSAILGTSWELLAVDTRGTRIATNKLLL